MKSDNQNGTLLISWLGGADRIAAGLNERQKPRSADDIGPLARAIVGSGPYDRVMLLDDMGIGQGYKAWLETEPERKKRAGQVEIFAVTHKQGPTEFRGVYQAVESVLSEMAERFGPNCRRVYHLSSGTPTMAAVWVLISQMPGMYGTLLETSEQRGAVKVELPFDIFAQYIPSLRTPHQQAAYQRSGAAYVRIDAFKNIVTNAPEMQRLKDRAAYFGLLPDTVLITGESGTGKELFARLIHEVRHARTPFQAINCAGIPRELLESELFGYDRGAHNMASREKQGLFELAGDGTLFLDEVGDLTLEHQAKVLRAIQEKKIRRVGGTRDIDVRCRIVAATNADLMAAVKERSFREDLFYRLAVQFLHLPPLRDRPEDIPDLSRHLLAKYNEEIATGGGVPGFPKEFSPGALRVFAGHHWSGNVRELENTVKRAAGIAPRDAIREEDARDALLKWGSKTRDVLGRALVEGFKLEDVLDEVRCHYLVQALKQAGGTLEGAAKLLGKGDHANYVKPLLKKCPDAEQYIRRR